MPAPGVRPVTKIEAPPSKAATPAPKTPGAASKPPVTTHKSGRVAENIADAYKALEERIDGGDKVAPEVGKPSTSGKPNPDVPAQEPPAREPVKPEEGEEPVEAPEPPKEAPKQEKASTLRERKDQLEKENKALQARVKEFESKAAAPDETEVKKLRETTETLQKRAKQLEERLQYTDYQQSEDYQDKYWKPFEETYQRAYKVVGDMEVSTPDGNVRPATQDDFDKVMGLASHKAARDLAKEMFPEDWPLVMQQRQAVLEKNEVRVKALEEFKKNGAELTAKQKEQQTQHRKALTELFRKEAETSVEKYPQWFKADKEDKKGAELLQRGFEYADSAFGSPAKDADGNEVKLGPEDMARRHSVVRNKAAGFDYAIHKLNLANALIKELQEKLKGFDESDPGGGEGRRKPAESAEDTMEGAMRKLGEMAR